MRSGAKQQAEKALAFECFVAATLAQWVYDRSGKDESPSRAPPISREITARVFIQDEETDTEGSAIVTSDKIYIVMRGTEGRGAGFWKDWKTNTDLLDGLSNKSEFFGLEVHPGFKKATESVLQQVADVLDLYRDRKKVVFVGHSLGGAIAVLLCVAISYYFRRDKDERELSVFTVGQPRVSRKRQLNLALRFITYVRIVAAADIITRIPRLGYSHGGDCLYITRQAIKAANAGTSVANPVRWNPGKTFMFFNRLGSGSGRIKHHNTMLPIKVLAGYLK